MRVELEVYFGRKLPNPTEAGDYVQTAFERLLRYKRPIQEPENFLRVTAHRLLKDAYRRRPRDLSWEALVGPDGSGLDHLTQFQTFEDSEFIEAHDAAVRGLASESRDAYILGELRGLPTREAGPLLGVSHTTAAARRDLATAQIREELA